MNKKTLLLLFLSLFYHKITLSQTAKDFGLREYSLQSKALGKVKFYISDSLSHLKKPVLVFLDGSGNESIFTFRKAHDGPETKFSVMPFDFKKMSKSFHILLISKPHTPLFRKLSIDENTPEDSVYHKYLSAEWRVRSASEALTILLKNYKVDKRKIVVFGYSEGAQVAPRLALYNQNITHCIAFVGGGLNQFYDEVIRLRMESESGLVSHQIATQKIDSLFVDFKKIYAKPNSTKDFWFGHTFKRWSSFTKTSNIDFLKKLKIPIYIAQGTADVNTSPLSTDYIRLEFLRLRKNNLTFKSYSDCDHFFTNQKTGINILDEVVNEAINWLN